MFKPDAGPGPNIYVTLRKIDWYLHDSALPAWTIDQHIATIPSGGDADSTSFPHWTGTVFNE